MKTVKRIIALFVVLFINTAVLTCCINGVLPGAVWLLVLLPSSMLLHYVFHGTMQ